MPTKLPRHCSKTPPGGTDDWLQLKASNSDLDASFESELFPRAEQRELLGCGREWKCTAGTDWKGRVSSHLGAPRGILRKTTGGDIILHNVLFLFNSLLLQISRGGWNDTTSLLRH